MAARDAGGDGAVMRRASRVPVACARSTCASAAVASVSCFIIVLLLLRINIIWVAEGHMRF